MSHDEWKNLDSVERLMTRAVTEVGAEISISAFNAEGKERQVERRPVRSAPEGMTWAISTFDRLFSEGVSRFRVRLLPLQGKPESASVRRKDGATLDEPDLEDDEGPTWAAAPTARDDELFRLQGEHRKLEARVRAADAELERVRGALAEAAAGADARADDLGTRLAAAEARGRDNSSAQAEITRLRRQVTEQQSQLQEAQSAADRAEDLAARLATAEAKVRDSASAQSEIGRLRRQLTELQSQLQQATDRAEEAETRLATAEARTQDAARAQSETLKMRRQLAERDRQIQDLEQRVADAEQRAADAESTLAQAESRMRRLQSGAGELSALRHRLAEAERARDEADQRASDAEARLRSDDRASRARPDTGEQRRLQRALTDVEHDRDELRARLEAQEAELRQIRGKAGADRDGRASMTDRARQLDQQVIELQRRISELEHENANLRDQNEMFTQDLLRRAEGVLGPLRGDDD